MAHEVKWLIENRLLLNKYVGVLGMDDLEGVSGKSIRMTEAVTDKFYVLGDFSELTSVQPTLSGMPELIKLSKAFTSKPNLGTIVAYGTDNKMIKFLSSVIIQIAKKNWKFFNSGEEALNHLMHIDPSLAPELETLLSTVVDD